jgi:hypothetical protein
MSVVEYNYEIFFFGNTHREDEGEEHPAYYVYRPKQTFMTSNGAVVEYLVTSIEECPENA